MFERKKLKNKIKPQQQTHHILCCFAMQLSTPNQKHMLGKEKKSLRVFKETSLSER